MAGPILVETTARSGGSQAVIAIVAGLTGAVTLSAVGKGNAVLAVAFSQQIGFSDNSVGSMVVGSMPLKFVASKTNDEGTHKISVFYGNNLGVSAATCTAVFAGTVNAEVVVARITGALDDAACIRNIIWDKGDLSKTTAKRNSEKTFGQDRTRFAEFAALCCKNTVVTSASVEGGTVAHGLIFGSSLEFFYASKTPGYIATTQKQEGNWNNISSSSWVAFSCFLVGDVNIDGGSSEYFAVREEYLQNLAGEPTEEEAMGLKQDVERLTDENNGLRKQLDRLQEQIRQGEAAVQEAKDLVQLKTLLEKLERR